MSHFSRIRLQPDSVTPEQVARLGHGNPYRDHQLLWQLFEGETRDFLFRYAPNRGWPGYYVVSDQPPADAAGVWDVAIKPYQPQLAAGELLSFSLRANPVVSRRDGEGRLFRHDVVMDLRKQLEGSGTALPPMAERVQQAGRSWLEKRAEPNGFLVEGGALRVEGYQQHRARPRKGGEIRFSTLDFSGVLRVTDPERFRHTLLQGLGPAKAFGCGLLLVRRLS